MKKLKFSALFLFILITLGCLSDNGMSDVREFGTSDIVVNVKPLDIDNNESVADLIVLYNVPSPNMGTDLNMFIIEKSSFSTISVDDFLSEENKKLQSVSSSEVENEARFSGNIQELKGRPLVHGMEYTIGFVVKSGEDFLLNRLSGDVTLSTDHYLSGIYRGLWNDNIYTNFGISANLKVGGNSISGPFYYSSSLTSCCGGDNDGSISMRLNDGQLDNFRYNQQLQNFMGGACPGDYTGSGVLKDYIILEIEFEGEDCEGPHTNGSIVLTRQF